MEIQINSYPIHFELGHEKTASDIVGSISGWVRERNLVFSNVFINGTRHSVDEVPDMDIAEVKELNSIVQSKSDVVIDAIDEGVRYCDRVIAYIADGLSDGTIRADQRENLAIGVEWLSEVLFKVFSLIGVKPEDAKFKDTPVSEFISMMLALHGRLATADGDAAVSISPDDREAFTAFKDIFRMVLMSEELKRLVINSFESPDTLVKMARSIGEESASQMKNIEEIALAFQTGKDNEGAEKLNTFIEFLYKFIRTCYQLSPVFSLPLSEIRVDGTTLEDKMAEIQGYLVEISNAMENRDIISLSDILEYEVKPALSNLGDYITRVLDTVSGEQDL